jgi:uncharacterized protein YhhL (DUF1145 family)
MTIAKWVLLVLYLVMAGIAVFDVGASLSLTVARVLGVLVAVHFAEFLFKFKTLRNAEGSLLNHFIQTMLFGFFHWRPLEKA